jgi:hypothetical protein
MLELREIEVYVIISLRRRRDLYYVLLQKGPFD